MSKRTILLFLSAIMLCTFALSCFASEIKQEPSAFSDVPANAWYAEAVAYCQENGWINGTSATTFTPNGTMTRTMVANALYNRAGSPAVTGKDAFTDAKEGAWYSNAVLWASQNDIITGHGNGLFGVNDPVTREQLVTILWRLSGSPAAESSIPFAGQNSISTYALTAVSWAKNSNIINGKNGNLLTPRETLPVRR